MAWTERQRALLEAMGLGLWSPRPGADASADAIERSPMAAPAAPPSAPHDSSTVAHPSTSLAADEPCLACPRRTAPIASCGAAEPAWMVVGAAPEADDVAAGRPFSGAAGDLLRRML